MTHSQPEWPIEKIAYSISEAAQASGLSRSKIYQLLRDGELTRHKLGKRTYILREDLISFMRSLPTGKWGGK